MIEVILGDITKISADAIVNAANTSLLGGGGVDGAIHRAGGNVILEWCRKIIARQGGCKTGEAVITPAGNLNAKFVIHTVGPVWTGGSKDESGKLASCYFNSLKLAVENKCRTIAFPCISTGIYKYPAKNAAKVALHSTWDFLSQNNELEKVTFVCFDETSLICYRNHIENHERLRKIVKILTSRAIVKYTHNVFDSGAIMVDVWSIDDGCYNIQLFDNLIGLSDIGDPENVAFDTRADRYFDNFVDFESELTKILSNPTK
jgi:O-acetyl-ADP-ribose deacetylase (regulator of RNase III)